MHLYLSLMTTTHIYNYKLQSLFILIFGFKSYILVLTFLLQKSLYICMIMTKVMDVLSLIDDPS